MRGIGTTAMACLFAASFAASSAGQTTAMRKKVLDVARKRALITQVKTVDAVLAKDKKELKDLNARGPQSQPIDLESVLPLDGLEEFTGLRGLQDVLHLSLKVYPDRNPDSAVYYYYPAGYYLSWDAENGYYLALDYKYEQESGNNVVIDARLSPGPVHRDRMLLAQLLKIYLKTRQNASADRVQLFELPARYEVEFDWTALGTAEVQVTGIDEVSRQIALLLTTDVPTREMLIKKLGDGLGLHGRVRILPEAVTGEEEPPAPLEVGARLLLTDAAYADARWQRETERSTSSFQNQHDFPVKLKYLCYLYLGPSAIKLRGYRLGDRILAPSAVARIPNDKITTQIEEPGRVLHAWYVYSLINEPSHRDSVIARLTGGVSDVPVKRVAIDLLKPEELFQQYHIHKIVVLARSRYFDPKGESSIERQHELTREQARGELEPLYLPDGETDSLYEYKIGVVTEAGEQFLDLEWRRPGVLGDITIGSVQVEEVLGR